MTAQYRVVVEGISAAGFDPKQVADDLRRLTGLSADVVQRLLIGAPTIVKRGASEALATKAARTLHGIGVLCRIEPEAVLELDLSEASVRERASTPAFVDDEQTQPATTATSSTLTKSDLYCAFLGATGPSSYLRYFEARDEGMSASQVHWPAFFFGWTWGIYRKLWGYALGVFIYELIIGAGVEIAIRAAALGPIAATAILVLAQLLPGLVAYGAMYRKARRVIVQSATIAEPSRRLEWVKAKGGAVGAWWIWLCVAVATVVVVVGIFAAILVPRLATQQRNTESIGTGGIQDLEHPASLVGLWRCLKSDGTGFQFIQGDSGAFEDVDENGQGTSNASAPTTWYWEDGALIWSWPDGRRTILDVVLGPSNEVTLTTETKRTFTCRRGK